MFYPGSKNFIEQVGMDSLPEGSERVESGESIDTANTVFVTAGDVIISRDGGGLGPARAFDAGAMLPLGGQPYGLGVLSTPTASVAEQEANPLVGEETTALIQRDAAKRVLAETGLTDADTVEWLAGPAPLSWPGPGEYTEPTLLGASTELEAFVGVVSGEDGPWGVFVTAARVTDEDHVVAVSGVTRPVSTTDGGLTAVEGSGWGMADVGTSLAEGVLSRAAAFTAEGLGRLERV